ncbi:hypothetical protein L9F63_006643 [Diploptera punctata]|uniref:Menorin-like domain-containing protein n=1 Tax=Diploptera punctata TaxID=6984 RepID=A0AAD8E4G9_DIPPU|nr:hypothetical protein L9F63_006643 [Diploptera punctata]
MCHLFTNILLILSTFYTLIYLVHGTSMQQYFPEIGNDLTKVTWGHAVNSKQLLEQAIQDNVMMLEADVVMGTVVGGSGDVIPVMAHPPTNTSDLSLKEFLENVLSVTQKGHRCGIKLDFKSIEVVSPSLDELQAHIEQLDFPVMLNADILPGPVASATTPVQADKFLQLCVKQFPESTLSVGWTTQYGGLIFTGSYSQEQVDEMEETLKRNMVTQPVTFPVRAGLAAKSASTLVKLKDNIANSTFTIWSSDGDYVDVDLLRTLIVDVIGRDRVYVDVPTKLMNQLNLTSSEISEFKNSASSTSSSVKAFFVSLITAVLFRSK